MFDILDQSERAEMKPTNNISVVNIAFSCLNNSFLFRPVEEHPIPWPAADPFRLLRSKYEKIRQVPERQDCGGRTPLPGLGFAFRDRDLIRGALHLVAFLHMQFRTLIFRSQGWAKKNWEG